MPKILKANLLRLTSGLQSGEKLIAIDFRPATGQLYALGNTSRLYFINLQTGVATSPGTTAFTPALSGNIAGFDFNPTVDRIRVVTSTGQNLRLNPETGTVAATDGVLKPGMPMVTGVAYTNSFSGATTTILYDIDIAAQKLYKQDPPNDGTLVEIGSFGKAITGETGFDISADNKVALLSAKENEKNSSDNLLYSVDLEKGKLTVAGKFSHPVTGIAIPTNPVAYAVDEMNNLHIFNPEKPSTTISKAISGLKPVKRSMVLT